MIEINLIPKQILVIRSRQRRALRWLSSCGMAVAVLVGIAGIDWLNRAEAYKLTKRRDDLRGKQTEVRLQLDSLRTVSHEFQMQIERARALHAKRPWSGMLSMTAMHLSDAMWLTQFSTIPETPTARSSRARKKQDDGEETEEDPTVTIDAPRQLKLEGYAVNASDPTTLVAALQAESIFEDVKLVQSQRYEQKDDVRFKFEIICSW